MVQNTELVQLFSGNDEELPKFREIVNLYSEQGHPQHKIYCIRKDQSTLVTIFKVTK